MLKKLWNCLGNGVKIGALSAAVLMNSGCAQSGSSNHYNGGVIENPDQNLESYYFLRHAFMEENAAIDRNASDAQKLAWGEQHFNAARTYLQEKTAAFEDRLATEPADNFLKTIYEKQLDYLKDANGNRINYFEKIPTVDNFLNLNNLVFPYVLGGISAKLVTIGDPSTVENYQNFKAHYNALALRAYNDSLGSLRNSDTLPYNQERFDINYDLFARTDNTYSIDDPDQIETTLYNMLQTVANKTGVSTETLVDTVNLSLLHASLWGARDLAAQSGFQLSSTGKLYRPDLNTIPYLNTKECLLEIGSGYNYQINKDEREYREQQQQNGLSR